MAPLREDEAETLLKGHPRFEFRRLLGFGAYAVVVEVWDTDLEALYAMKILKFEPQNKIASRFRQEASALRAISSQHLIRTFDFLQIDDHLALIMELMDNDLESHLREHGTLCESDAVMVTIAIASALEEAHELGIIHRDIKPSNVLLRDGLRVIRVCDFGVARASGGHQGLTMTGTTMGSLPFMAPEQAKDAATVDGRADIFSLGKLLFTLLDLSQLEMSADSFPSFVDLGLLSQSSISEPVANVIRHATRLDREERYADMGEMIEALRALQDHTEAIPESKPESMTPVTDEIEVPRRRWRGLLAGIAVIAAVLVVSCTGGLWHLFGGTVEPSVTEIVEAPVMEVATPEPETVVVEEPEMPVKVVEVEPPALEPEPLTVAKAVKPAKVKAPEPKPSPPPVVRPDPPKPTTGTVSINRPGSCPEPGCYHLAQLEQRGTGYAIDPNKPLPPGDYDLIVTFRSGGSKERKGTVTVVAGETVKIRCNDAPDNRYNCKW